MADVVNLGGTAIKPEGWDRTKWESFKNFLYDPKKGAFFSRTPSSWVKIILFYTIYYSVLTVFWIGCLQAFFATLPEGQPRWLLDESLIGSNPGLGMRPRMPDSQIDSSLYLLAAGSEDMEQTNEEGEGLKNVDYAVRMKHFLERYENTTGMVDCSNEPNQVRSKDQDYCIFDTTVLEECTQFPYGYVVDHQATNVAEPCFLLKFNKLFNWEPVPVNETKLDDPEYAKMSDTLKNRIRKSMDKNYLWVDCAGRFAADSEALDIEYFPAKQGIPLKYFPFRGGLYNHPLVAIKVRQTQKDADGRVNYGQLLHLECRAWFDGVVHDTKHKAGLVQFEILLAPMN